MADVQAAVDAVLRQEDATLSGAITSTPGDTGGRTRFGLAAKWHPELTAGSYYTTMSTAEALQIAEDTLTRQYAAPMLIGQITDQALATKVLSFGINAGVRVAIEALQNAINAVLPGSNLDVTVDGVCGPGTIAAANRCLPSSLLNSFMLRMIEFYRDLCRRHASDRNELLGWLDRALA